MMHPVIHRPRPRYGAIAASAVLLSLSVGAAPAAADPHRDPGSRDRYYSYDDHRDGGYYHDGYRGKKHGKKKHYDDHYHGYEKRYDDRYYGHYYSPPTRYARPFIVPRHLDYYDYPAYDRYYRGAVYYAPHHHRHRIYLFPVIVDGYVDYVPHAYCGDAYYPAQYPPGYGYDDGRGHLGLHFDY